ncbi:MAG: hypothetical protein WDW36_001873 [Sanguina aurantia]
MFERACKSIYLVGVNAYDMLQLAQVLPADYETVDGKTGKQVIAEAMANAQGRGVNVIRAWAHSSDPKFPFQVAPGVYREEAFRSLDFVLHQASLHNIHLILSFVDNWKYYNGIDQYVDWSPSAPKRSQDKAPDNQGDPTGVMGTKNSSSTDIDAAKLYEAKRHTLFFVDPGARSLFRNHIDALVHRRNVFNGRMYRDDPTILAWDLANEPRCETAVESNCHAMVHAWVEEMSLWVKRLDPNHLVTIGSEGFFGPSTPDMLQHNPGSWADEMGQDFVLNNAVPTIDFSTIHIWPDQWGTELDYEKFLSEWLASHVNASRVLLNKPVLLEEFGKKLVPDDQTSSGVGALRNPVYADTYGELERIITNASNVQVQQLRFQQQAQPDRIEHPSNPDTQLMGPLVGSLFWKWQLHVFVNNVKDEYGVSHNDSTLDLVAQHAEFVQGFVQKSDQSYQQSCKVDCWVPSPASIPSVKVFDMDMGESAVSMNNSLSQSTSQDADVTLHNTCVSLPQACSLSWRPGAVRRTQLLDNSTGTYRSTQLVSDYSGRNSSGTGSSSQPSYQNPNSHQGNGSMSANAVQAGSLQLQAQNASLDASQYPELSSNSVVARPAAACQALLALNASSWLVSTPDPPIPGSPTVILRLSCMSDGSSRLSPLPPRQLTQTGDLVQPGLFKAQLDQQQWQRVYSSQSECCSSGGGAFAPMGCS